MIIAPLYKISTEFFISISIVEVTSFLTSSIEQKSKQNESCCKILSNIKRFHITGRDWVSPLVSLPPGAARRHSEVYRITSLLCSHLWPGPRWMAVIKKAADYAVCAHHQLPGPVNYLLKLFLLS